MYLDSEFLLREVGVVNPPVKYSLYSLMYYVVSASVIY